MRCMKTGFSLIAVVAFTTGCTTTLSNDLPPVEPETIIKTAPVVVAVPCVSEGGKPSAVVPLRDRVSHDEWYRRASGAKARAVQAQAGRRMNYETALEASTAGCTVKFPARD